MCQGSCGIWHMLTDRHNFPDVYTSARSTWIMPALESWQVGPPTNTSRSKTHQSTTHLPVRTEPETCTVHLRAPYYVRAATARHAPSLDRPPPILNVHILTRRRAAHFQLNLLICKSWRYRQVNGWISFPWQCTEKNNSFLYELEWK